MAPSLTTTRTASSTGMGCQSSLALSRRPCLTLGFFSPRFSGVSVATCVAILHVGSTQQVRTGSTSSKEEDYENDAATIVQKCVSRWCSGEHLILARFWKRWKALLTLAYLHTH